MKNISEVVANVSEVFQGLKTGAIEPKVATEMTNAVGKIISACKVQLAYHALRGEKPEIDFLSAPIKPADILQNTNASDVARELIEDLAPKGKRTRKTDKETA